MFVSLALKPLSSNQILLFYRAPIEHKHKLPSLWLPSIGENKYSGTGSITGHWLSGFKLPWESCVIDKQYKQPGTTWVKAPKWDLESWSKTSLLYHFSKEFWGGVILKLNRHNDSRRVKLFLVTILFEGTRKNLYSRLTIHGNGICMKLDWLDYVLNIFWASSASWWDSFRYLTTSGR